MGTECFGGSQLDTASAAANEEKGGGTECFGASQRGTISRSDIGRGKCFTGTDHFDGSQTNTTLNLDQGSISAAIKMLQPQMLSKVGGTECFRGS